MSNIKYAHIFTKEFLENKFKELGSINAIAKEFNLQCQIVRRYFIKYEIPYKKLIRYKFNEDFFETITEESLYIAGFIAADGSVGSKNNCISITLASKDIEILEKINKALELNKTIRVFNVTARSGKILEHACLAFSSKKMKESLAKWGIAPRKTYNFAIPEWLENLPAHQIAAFLRGFTDGDGCWRIYTSNGVIATAYKMIATKEFCEQIIKTFLKFELITHAPKTRPRNPGSSAYLFDIGGNKQLQKIANFIYQDANIYLERKYKIVKEILLLETKPETLTKEEILNFSINANDYKDLEKLMSCTKGNITYLLNKYNIIDEVKETLKQNRLNSIDK